jgi:transcriptional regulator with XRE-family HTH domain
MHLHASKNPAPTSGHVWCTFHAMAQTPLYQAILAEPDYRREVGERLRQLIDALGLSYVQAAQMMLVPKNHLGNWMRGDAFPRHYNLYRFCRINGVNTDWVLLGDYSALPYSVVEALLQQAPALEVVAAPEGPEPAAAKRPRASKRLRVSST